ncbi:MAG: hypothetical protein WAT20_03430 [Ferruginibacter sp.]|nr:hypothetical protein [Chitinophagaceae bacterium]
MKEYKDNLNQQAARAAGKEKDISNPLPVYPPGDDIYNKNKKEEDIEPEDILKNKAPNSTENGSNEKDFEDDVSGEDLDIPGAELDDKDEAIGSEDEENNHYSLGGDNYNDLEEDKGG